ncbi:MAG TPA: histidine kinase [Acidimicrobiales bacterium]|nr:histidine kinase [Acidimicrobiales bacterium]
MPRAGPLGAVTTAVRWAALLLVVFVALGTRLPARALFAIGALALYTFVRASAPSPPRRRALSIGAVSLEAGLLLVLSFASGAWSSPILLALGASFLVAGLEAGIAGVVAATGTTVVGAVSWIGVTGAVAGTLRVAASVASLACIGAIGAYGRGVHEREASAASEVAGRASAAAERGRLARELHDRLGQSLVAIALGLDRLCDTTPAAARERGELEVLVSELHHVVRLVREQLWDLRSAREPDAALEEELRELLGRVSLRSGVRTRFEVTGSHRLEPAVEEELWQIAREAVLNAERHARADLISVRVERDVGEVRVEVCDDGRGLDGTGERPSSFGILGMRERARSIGAVLDIADRTGGGTTVTIVRRSDQGDAAAAR